MQTHSLAAGGGGHSVVIGGGGVNLRLMEERLSRLEEIVNLDPGLTARLRNMDSRISQLQVRSGMMEVRING